MSKTTFQMPKNAGESLLPLRGNWPLHRMLDIAGARASIGFFALVAGRWYFPESCLNAAFQR
jgi:hypothetical protein